MNNDVSKMFSGKQEKIHWGSAYSLWEICRFKVIGIPVLDLLLNNTEDSDLKALLDAITNSTDVPNIKKTQEFMMDHGMTYPPIQERGAISDQEIARAIKEIIRLALMHETHAFISISRKDERGFIENIFDDDMKSYNRIISICRSKGWLLDPPNIQ